MCFIGGKPHTLEVCPAALGLIVTVIVPCFEVFFHFIRSFFHNPIPLMHLQRHLVRFGYLDKGEIATSSALLVSSLPPLFSITFQAGPEGQIPDF